MRCSKAQRWISRRADGVLGKGLEAPLAEHLAECGACRAHAEALAALQLDLFGAPEPTHDFVARIAQRVEEMPARRRSVLRRPAVFRPVAAGLGVAAALGGFAIGSHLELANGVNMPPPNGTVELAAGDTIDPLAEDSVESVLIALLSNGKE
jgi:predicted anti-sigma-YlaC factor YlaD